MSGNTQLEERFNHLLDILTEQFGQEADLTAALFLVGIQETGKGFQDYNRDEKMKLIHIGGARVLSYWNYYLFEGFDEEGFPYYAKNWEKGSPWGTDQEYLFKEGLIHYFIEMGYDV